MQRDLQHWTKPELAVGARAPIVEDLSVLKSRLPRFIALLGTVGVLASLVSVAVAGTGAYFTASQSGTIISNSGTVAVTVTGQNITFANLLPGVQQTQTVAVHNTGTGSEDIYLVFDNTNLVWSGVNTLGQYGKFTIGGYVYDNLTNDATALTPGVAGAPETGFMTTAGACSTVHRVPINYLPHVIFLGTVAAGMGQSVDISFLYNACTTTQGSTASGTLNFNIAAFQNGILPSDPFNGTSAIAPLSGVVYQ
jgi:hypothetical protein